jgi:hypothetical protein
VLSKFERDKVKSGLSAQDMSTHDIGRQTANGYVRQ